jgi:gliding motility-associated lipoprotein GldH
MKKLFSLLSFAFLLVACDQEKVYHAYVDFEERIWLVNKVPQFTFAIEDTTQTYDVFCNIRNTTQYPWSRIFIQYTLSDTLGHVQEDRLLQDHLFDAKTGEPHGTSALGDLYDHDIPVLKNYKFSNAGPHRIRFEQKMRMDSLTGIVSLGLEVRRVVKD